MAVVFAENQVKWASWLDNSLWIKNRLLADFVGAGGPTGRIHRLTVAETGGTDPRTLSQSAITAVVGQQYTLGAWVRDEAMVNKNVTLHLYDTSDPGARVRVTLNIGTGTLGDIYLGEGAGGRVFANPACGVQILNVGGWMYFWVRATLTGLVSGTPAFGVILQLHEDAEPGESMFCGGFRLSRGPDASVFIDSFNAPRVLPSYEFFDFPFHTFETEYMDSGDQVQLGKGWSFATKPNAPPQRVFTLNFSGMRYIMSPNGARDLITDPQLNMGLLEDFFQRHRLSQPFFYNHPFWGRLRCRFQKPVKVPRGVVGGSGVLQAFDVYLIEFPIGPNTDLAA